MAVKISRRPNGPYLVEGEVELVDVDDNKIDTSARGPRRAGASGHWRAAMPFAGLPTCSS
jgi:hypothetical protein